MKYLILLKFIPFEMAIISMVFLLSFKQLLVNDYYTFISIVYGIVLIFSGIFAYLLMDKKPISSNWKLKSFLGKFLLLFFINMWLVPFVNLKRIQDHSQVIDGVYAYKSLAFTDLPIYTYAFGFSLLIALLLLYGAMSIAE
ncbi:MAG TPA: hypothetical protein VEP90_13170 [Methylomirabilota bacterium]|nr:hypothetical protein [Methylomirabilota bacterium]